MRFCKTPRAPATLWVLRRCLYVRACVLSLRWHQQWRKFDHSTRLTYVTTMLRHSTDIVWGCSLRKTSLSRPTFRYSHIRQASIIQSVRKKDRWTAINGIVCRSKCFSVKLWSWPMTVYQFVSPNLQKDPSAWQRQARACFLLTSLTTIMRYRSVDLSTWNIWLDTSSQTDHVRTAKEV